MDPVNDQNSKAVDDVAEYLSEQQISADLEMELSYEQRAALQRILQDAPLLMSEEELAAQQSFQQQSEIWQRNTQSGQQRNTQSDQQRNTQSDQQNLEAQNLTQIPITRHRTQTVRQQRPVVSEPEVNELKTKKSGRSERISARKSAARNARKSTKSNEQRPGQNENTNGQDRPKKRSSQNVIITVVLIIILSAASFFGWYYWWTTYATFDYKLHPIVILEGQHIEPGDFLAHGENFQRVTAVYRNPVFRPTPGKQEVQLTLTMGWRIVDASTTLYVLTPLSVLEHEFAEVRPELNAADLVLNTDAAADTSFDLHFAEEPKLLEDYAVGEYNLRLSLNGVAFDVPLVVADTIAPEAVPVDNDIMIGEELRPEAFVTGVSDASDHLPILITYYGEEADAFGRDQNISVKVEDYYGNYTVVQAKLTVKHNTEPPVIEGTDTVLSMVGDPVMYLQGVTAYDDFGRDITERVTVDSSDVDQYTIGVYTVTYRVEDFTGLSFEVEEKVHVLDLDIDVVNEEVDKILEDIIEEDMTQLEQVHAIFSWVRSNITYALNRDRPETAYEGAYRALRERRGNCYIFYSISELLLTRAEIPNMLIERIPGTSTRHRWNLINPDGLGWHHFDSYPYPMRLGLGIQRAFFTSSQALEYTRMISNLDERPMPDYYTFDPSLYPPIVQ